MNNRNVTAKPVGRTPKSAAQKAKELEERKNLTPEQKKQLKRKNFVKLASKRLPKAVKAISQLGNLASPQYTSSDKDVEKIEKALVDAINNVLNRFRKSGNVVNEVTFDD